MKYSLVYVRNSPAARALDTTQPNSLRHDARVIGLVGLAHALSHFFQLALPPLYPFLKAEFGVSFATLGTLAGVFYAASATTQFVAGFAVDRFGARQVLLPGITLMAGGALLAAVAPGFGWLYPVVAIMGIGNGVFHPADFAILNASVGARRLGHAYSVHGVSGNLGYALAPVLSFGLGAAFGWRTAIAVMGLLGSIGVAVLFSQRQALTCGHTGRGVSHTLSGTMALLVQLPIVMCFLYFCVYVFANMGLQTFFGPALNAAFGIPLGVAATALTAWLLGGTAGIVAGGVLATRTDRHDRVAGAGLLVGAATMLVLVYLQPGQAVLLPLFALTGFAIGVTGPSRDMIVRKATPPGAAGRVYGFVYSGLDLGSVAGPIWFGFLLDHGASRQVFITIAVCYLAAIATVLQVRRTSVARGAAAST